MRINVRHIWQRLLRFLRFWPLPLAKKVQVTFGAAVLLVLTLALSIPYIWMGQLIKKDLLDTGRSRSKVILDRHFQLKEPGQTRMPLDSTGQVRDPNDGEISWIRFTEDDGNILPELDKEIRDIIETLSGDPDRHEHILLERNEGRLESHYIRIFRATGRCTSCHNPQGTADPFALNKLIGAVIIRNRDLASEINKTVFMNRIWIIVAGLIGGAGAIIVFYMITQRLILRPIRQLRALANNVAEGNLEIRSSIATRDEYEKLAKAFNHMLDTLQAMQEKLRQANKQLDAKIAELSGRN
ncbi:MAG: HAMP domain-containing protein, partial [Planctomycetota bacterium]